MNVRPHILLVEDNEGDIILTTEAFLAGNFNARISVVRTGQEALDFIAKTNNFKDAQRPDIILLDINLPGKNGYEVLAELKSSTAYKHIPIIMLTTSSAPEDVRKAYHLHVNSYITKPIDINDFLEAVGKIESFWFGIARLAV